MTELLSPQEQRRQDRIIELKEWAATQTNILTSISSGNLSTAQSFVFDHAMVTYNCSTTTATSYAHNVVLNLTSAVTGSSSNISIKVDTT